MARAAPPSTAVQTDGAALGPPGRLGGGVQQTREPAYYQGRPVSLFREW